jgi:hypothetical protein
MHHLTTYLPHIGSSDATFHLFRADGARRLGEPSDPNEAERVEWKPWTEVRSAIAAGRVSDGLGLTALLWVMAGLDGPGGSTASASESESST